MKMIFLMEVKVKTTNLIFSGIAVLFGLLVIFIPVFRLSVSKEGLVTMAVAQEEDEPETAVEMNKESIDASNQEADYYLPYPGILPDHTFYWLKMIRDRVTLWLTKEPVKKFDRLLLYADKRLGAAIALVQGGQENLGVSTATKAEKYLEQAAGQYRSLQSTGQVNPELENRFRNALLKHEQELGKLKEKVSDPQKANIDKAMVMPQSLTKDLFAH